MDQLCNIFAHACCCCRRCTRNDISFCIAFFIFFFRFTFQLTDHKENRNRSRVKIASHALSRALRVSLFDHMCLCAQLITFSRLVTLYFFIVAAEVITPVRNAPQSIISQNYYYT